MIQNVLTPQLAVIAATALLVGFAVGWKIRSVILNKRFTKFGKAWEEKFHEKNRQLAAANNELNTRVSRIRSLEAELGAEVSDQNRLVTRLNELQHQLEKYQDVDALLKEADVRKQSAEAEIARVQLQLKEAEPLAELLSERNQRIRDLETQLAARASTPAQATATEPPESARALLAEKDREIARLRERVDGLDAAAIQMKNKLAETLNSRFAEMLRKKDEAMAVLRKENDDHNSLASQNDEKSRKIAEMENRLASVLREKEFEIGKLKWRINELEPLAKKLIEQDIALGEWDARFEELIRRKDDEIDALLLRIKELEAGRKSANGSSNQNVTPDTPAQNN